MRLFVAVAGATGIWLVAAGTPLLHRDRLRARVEPYLSDARGRPSRLLARNTRADRGIARWIAARVGGVPSHRVADLARRLDAAGFDGGPEAFRVGQATWGVIAATSAGCALVLLAGVGAPVDLKVLPLLVVTGFVTGWLARDWWLGREVEARSGLLAGELPTAIDLITLSIMAGESVGAACSRAASALGPGAGEELGRVVAETRSGVPVVEALEAMGRRVPDPSVGRFVDALCTGIEKGAPLADVLRAQADDARDARRRRLLELGGRREVLMLVPVVFLIMPVVVVFALFPGLVSLDLLVP
ncbi:MAG TPA: type II secretion system F family protein [Actinomycetota bacterium]|jgi:tight adherence protein C